MLSIYDLTVEGQRSPLAVEGPQPRFSWKLSGARRGCRQCAYRLLVKQEDGILWDSGKVASDQTLNIPYGGATLVPEQRYTWTVTVWDELEDSVTAGAFFEMAPEDWHGAKWIGSDTLNLSAHTQSVFQFSYTVEICEDSQRAGFLFGGNDSRLMDRNKNIMGTESGRDESYIALVLDVGPVRDGGAATFAAYRHGYAPDDDGTPLYCTDISRDIIHEGNCHRPHTVLVKCVYGEIEVFLDGPEHCISKGKVQGPFSSDAWNLNPVGQGNNFTCFPLLCDVGISMEKGQQAVFSEFSIRNYRQPCNALLEGWPKTILGGGAQIWADGGISGIKILADPSHGGMPMLRTEFTVAKPIKRARIYATARGVYELSLNGRRVGTDWLAPGLSQYNKTHFYQTYDVTDDLLHGENALGAYLAEGWWSGAITFSGDKWNFFGDRQSFLCRLVITYEDGTVQNIVSSPDTWQYSTDGPIVYSSLFQGEIYNSEREQPGWDRAGFQGESWFPAREIPLGPSNAFIGDMILPPFGQRVSQTYENLVLAPQPDPGVRTAKILTAQAMTEPRPGVYIYDMGQNMAGVPEITMAGTAGQQVTLRYAEILYPDMAEYKSLTGMLMLENIRGALAQDTVVLKDGVQTIRPHFTFHGYRYLELTGIDGPLPLEAVRGVSLSSVDICAEFRCSDERITRLYENICWSLRDNFISIPTDCPQRNERMGWSGDLSVFSRTATYMADCSRFLWRHMTAMRDTQSPEGRFDDVAPVGGGFGGILWGSAGITAAWEAYRQFGDQALLKAHFPAMCRYIRYLQGRLDPETGLVQEGPLGDWLGPENEKNEPALLWQSYYIYDLWVVLQTAELLEEREVVRELQPVYDAARDTFHRTFLDPVTGETVYSSEQSVRGEATMGPPRDGPAKPLPPKTPGGKYRMDTQTSYAVPLALGVLEEAAAEKAREHLRRTVRRENIDDSGVPRPPYSLMTGFIGTAWLCPALSQSDGDRDAWRLLRQDTYPSWLYPVRQGATTIWERLDSFTLDRGFGGNNSMNSFNHYSFGAVGTWMLSRILGVCRGTAAACWDLEPTPDPDGAVTWAAGSVQTVRGAYESAWRKTESGMEYHITIPANTTTILRLPANMGCQITEGGGIVAEAPGVEDLGFENGRAVFRLQSGSFRFCVSD